MSSNSRGRGRGRGRGLQRARTGLRPSPAGPNLADRITPMPFASIPNPSLDARVPPPSRQDSSASLNTQPQSTGFHDSLQQARSRARQDSQASEETLVNDFSNFKGSFAPRAGTSPPDSVYSGVRSLKGIAPYAMRSDSDILNEPTPFDSISQRGALSEYGGSRIGRSVTYDDRSQVTTSRGGFAPKAHGFRPDFQQETANADAAAQLRQRMPSVIGSASDFLGRFDPNGRFSSSMSTVSMDRDATSDAFFKRQRINPKRAKTKKVKLTKGRFIAEYG